MEEEFKGIIEHLKLGDAIDRECARRFQAKLSEGEELFRKILLEGPEPSYGAWN